MTIYQKIINNEIPSHKIWEDDKHIAILDINPIKAGHILVIPKKVTDYIFDLNDEEYIELFLAAKHVATIIREKLNCKKVGILVEGLAINHIHIHLIPCDNVNDINPLNAKPATQEDLEKVYNILTS